MKMVTINKSGFAEYCIKLPNYRRHFYIRSNRQNSCGSWCRPPGSVCTRFGTGGSNREACRTNIDVNNHYDWTEGFYGINSGAKSRVRIKVALTTKKGRSLHPTNYCLCFSRGKETITIYISSLAIGLFEDRRFGNRHLYSSKVAGVLLYLFAIHLFLSNSYNRLFFLAAVTAFMIS